MQHKILVVLTNVETLSSRESKGEKKTGFDVKSVAYIWHTFARRKSLTIEVCTPKGGETQMDPDILEMSKNDSVVQEFLKERKIIDQFKDTSSISQMNPEEFCLVVLPGGHGSMIDFPKMPELTNFLSKIVCRQYEHENRPSSSKKAPLIATIGHGIAALLNVKLSRHGGGGGRDLSEDSTLTSGEYYLKDKRVTCFTNEEERKIGYDQVIPFSLEDKLKSIGAKLELGSPFEEKVVRESKYLITGQNPQSAKKWIETILDSFREVVEEN